MPEFELGQKVYKVKDVLRDAEDHKTAPKFEGPYNIVDQAPHNVYKLKHFHTGKTLNSYVHVNKLKASDTTTTIMRLCKCKKRRCKAYQHVAKATAAETAHEASYQEVPADSAGRPADVQPEPTAVAQSPNRDRRRWHSA